MKSLLLSLFIFSSLFGAISEFKQDDYQIIIGNNFDDEALDIVEDYDYNISAVGYTQDFQTTVKIGNSYTNAFDYLSSVQGHNGEQLRIIKLNLAAKVVNDKSFKLSNYNRGTNILKTVQNGYLIGGYTFNGQMIISQLDTQSKPSYLKQFGTANFDQLHALIPMKDGGSVAIGTSQTSRNPSDDMFVQGLGRSDVYLVRFTPNGQIRWRKKYGSTEKDIGVDGVATGDGGFILLGISQEADEFRLSCAKINDTGDIAWIKKFPKAGRQKAFKIIKTIRGNYLISASFENSNNQDNIRFIKIDNEGNVIWEKNYFNNANEHLNDISVDFRGNIIGVGYSQDASQGDMDALVRYYDHTGKQIWERKFGKNRHDSFKSVTLLHDNTFAIAGFTTSFADKMRQIWIMKLHDDGSLVKKQIKIYANLYEALVNEFRNTPQVHIYKDLRITHNGLIFAQGSSFLTKEHKKVLQGFMPRLLRVLALYKININNLSINGYTSTEWNAPSTQRYLKNAHLSNNRAMNILDYSYQLKQVKKYQKWMSQVLSTDGYSYSNLIYANKKENKIRSRRVEFEITLK
ncbi:MAG: hypothetical protein COA44_00005 [Arcobacter sp.]|nr:MAG: hypothetical protein COA44_00005 [Arcobacter sp.]